MILEAEGLTGCLMAVAGELIGFLKVAAGCIVGIAVHIAFGTVLCIAVQFAVVVPPRAHDLLSVFGLQNLAAGHLGKPRLAAERLDRIINRLEMNICM